MSELSRFFGIVIMMHYREHGPPHFHAIYGDYEVTIDINTGLVKGVMPKRALSMIFEWYEKYRSELIEDWDIALKREHLKKIPPLE